jgi:hypothetical protein
MMRHLFEILVKGMKKAEFMEGLQARCQEGVKELKDLWKYVKHLEDQLHKVGS